MIVPNVLPVVSGHCSKCSSAKGYALRFLSFGKCTLSPQYQRFLRQMIPSIPAVTMSDRPLLQQKLHNFGRSALTDAELLALLIGKGHNGRASWTLPRICWPMSMMISNAWVKRVWRNCRTSGIGVISAFTLLTPLSSAEEEAQQYLRNNDPFCIFGTRATQKANLKI